MKFAEFHMALLLDREGFESWSQVHLFDDPMPLFKDGQPVRRGRDNAVRNTLHIMRHPGWSWRWPSEIQQTLDFRPRNPDIVAYRQGKRPEWRFCEVKGPADRCSGGHFTEQLNALAVLHLLTGSPVAIVRPVEQGRLPRAPRTVRSPHQIQRWSAVGLDLPLEPVTKPDWHSFGPSGGLVTLGDQAGVILEATVKKRTAGSVTSSARDASAPRTSGRRH